MEIQNVVVATFLDASLYISENFIEMLKWLKWWISTTLTAVTDTGTVKS